MRKAEKYYYRNQWKRQTLCYKVASDTSITCCHFANKPMSRIADYAIKNNVTNAINMISQYQIIS